MALDQWKCVKSLCYCGMVWYGRVLYGISMGWYIVCGGEAWQEHGKTDVRGNYHYLQLRAKLNCEGSSSTWSSRRLTKGASGSHLYRPYSKSSLTLNEWKFNLSFSRVSLLFLSSWRASVIPYYVTTHPPAIQKQHRLSREAQIEPPLIECEWAFRIQAYDSCLIKEDQFWGLSQPTLSTIAVGRNRSSWRKHTTFSRVLKLWLWSLTCSLRMCTKKPVLACIIRGYSFSSLLALVPQ